MQGEIRLGYSVGSGLSLGHPGSTAGGADRVQHSMNQGSQAVAVSLHHLEGACSSPQLQPPHLCCFKKAEQGGSELLAVFSEAVTRN